MKVEEGEMGALPSPPWGDGVMERLSDGVMELFTSRVDGVEEAADPVCVRLKGVLGSASLFGQLGGLWHSAGLID